MSLRNHQQLMSACLVALALSGCAQMSAKLPSVSLKRPQSDETRLNVARLYERQNRLGAARKLYTELHDEDPDNLLVMHRLAAISTRLGDFEAAQKYFQQSLAIDPDNAEVLADLGYAQYLHGDLETAEATLRRSLSLNPDSQRTVGNLALVAGMNGQIDESLSLYRQIVDEAEAQANVAYIHVQRGEGELAMQRYDRALTLDQSLTSAANALVKLAALKDENAIPPSTNPMLHIADKPESAADDIEIDMNAELVRGQSSLRHSGRTRIRSPRNVTQTVEQQGDDSAAQPPATPSLPPKQIQFQLPHREATVQ